MDKVLTQEDLLKIKDAATKASESTIPFPIVKDGNVAVVGDANKTELNKHDFQIAFCIPDPMSDSGYSTKVVEYKDVYPKPRHASEIERLATMLMPIIHKAKADGTVEDYSQEELVELAKELNEGAYDLMYQLVAKVVGIHEDLIDYMTPKTVVESTLKIFICYPDMINAGEAFFAF